ncbi:UBP1-associated proteins 1A-like [Syzygium oleosum]|uniref:UBP1-associated proteins 1A-like n=1 Tax=Syzygium oleosum TaxID=219896 RepID=UPI0024B8EC35|nr:UBP1-associated proteins 1A-like [Syzygium oleosum]
MAKTGNKTQKLKLSKDPTKMTPKKLKVKKTKKQRPRPMPDSDSDSEPDSDKLPTLLEPYTKDQLVDLITSSALANPALYGHIREVADRDVAHRKIFVYGLAWEATPQSLAAAFASFGDVEDCNVVTDRATGKSKGYGFVLFRTRKGAVKALKEPKKKIDNRVVSCQLASIGRGGTGVSRDSNSAVKKVDVNRAGAEVKGKNQVRGQPQARAPAPARAPGPALAPAFTAAQNLSVLNQYPGLHQIYGGLLANPGALGFVNPAIAGALNQSMLALSQGNLGQGMAAATQSGVVGGGAGGSVLGAYGGSSSVPQLGLQHFYAANMPQSAQQTAPFRAKGGGASSSGFPTQT